MWVLVNWRTILIMQKSIKAHTHTKQEMYEEWHEFEKFPAILKVRGARTELIGSRTLAHAQEQVPRTRYLHKERKMSAVPLDAVLGRRNLTMFPEISTGWSPDSEGEKCRLLDHKTQIPLIHSVQYDLLSHFHINIEVWPVTASKWYIRVFLSGNYLTSAHVFFKTMSLRLRKISQAVLTPIRYVPVCIDTEYIEYMMLSHAHIF